MSERRRPGRRSAGGQRVTRAPFVLLIVGLLLAGMGLLLALNTVSAAEELRRNDVVDRNADVAAAVVQASEDVASSAAPQALASAASQLGMVPNPNPAFLSQAPDGSVRVLGTPSPASGAPVPAPATPTASPTASPTGTTTATPTGTSTASPTGSATATATGTAPIASTVPASTVPAPTVPAPTVPAPTSTLPGGPR